MSTYTVSALAGSDSNPGTNASPFKTIGKANTLAVAGDTVIVEGDGNVYVETATGVGTFSGQPHVAVSKDGVSYIGTGSNSRPVLEGGGVRSVGIGNVVQGNHNISIRGFEIRNVLQYGVWVRAKRVPNGCQISQLLVHHVNNFASLQQFQYGIYTEGGDPQVTSNEIHHIGQGGEARGVFMYAAGPGSLCDGNNIYAVRKAAIRIAECLGLRVTNNRGWFSSYGMDEQQCVSTLIANNGWYLCTNGLVHKHTHDPTTALAGWGLDRASAIAQYGDTKIWHNTVHECTEQHGYIAINLTSVGPPPTGFTFDTQWRNNLFTGVGRVYVADAPASRDTTITLDHNVYASNNRANLFYAREAAVFVDPIYLYPPSTDPGYVEVANWTTIEQLRADPTAPWEANGRYMTVQLENPAIGDLDPVVPIPGTLELPSDWGSQVGCRLLGQTAASWQPDTAIVVNFTTPGREAQWPLLVDALGANTAVLTATNIDEAMTIDLGSQRPFDHLWWGVWGHQRPASVKIWSLETSDDNSTWTRIVDHALFPDSEGSDFYWELDAVHRSRYVKFIAHSGYGAVNFAFAHMEVGVLATTVIAPPTAAPQNAILPAISGTAQTGQTVTCSTGTWLNNPTSFAYQWKRDGSNVSTGASRVLVAADETHLITCQVTATNAIGSTAATSASITPTAGTSTGSAPVNTVLPSITTTGAIVTDATATALNGTWLNAPTSYTYQWTRDGTNIAAATGRTYVFVMADESHQVRVAVTATNASGNTTATSGPVVPTSAPSAPITTPLVGDCWGVDAILSA